MTITSVDSLHCVSSMTEKVEIAKMSIILILKDESSPYYEGIKRVMYPECQVSPISPLSSPHTHFPAKENSFPGEQHRRPTWGPRSCGRTGACQWWHRWRLSRGQVDGRTLCPSSPNTATSKLHAQKQIAQS